MKLCILEADRPAEDFQPVHGTYAGMFERWLAPDLPGAEFSRVWVRGGAALPEDPTAFDAYLVTGSRCAAYEDHPWIPPLEAFLRAAAEARRPLAGVCFGHQIMAQAFGGTVVKSPDGWVIGRQDHATSAAGATLFDATTLSALSFHQDQVTDLPPGAERLLSNAASPNGGLIYRDFPAISVQFHPEFAPAYVRDLLLAANRIRVPEPLAQAALATLSGPTDGARIARSFARFLSGAAA